MAGEYRPPDENLTSHGQIQGQAPVFSHGECFGEIMTVKDQGGETVEIYYEDPDEPQILRPQTMTRVDYLELLADHEKAEHARANKRFLDQADEEDL